MLNTCDRKVMRVGFSFGEDTGGLLEQDNIMEKLLMCFGQYNLLSQIVQHSLILLLILFIVAHHLELTYTSRNSWCKQLLYWGRKDPTSIKLISQPATADESQ
jgi:hypothetical protein